MAFTGMNEDAPLSPEETQKLPEAMLANMYSVSDDGNNNPDIPLDPGKLGIDEFLVDRLSHKPLNKYKFRRSIACGGMKMVLEVRDMDTMRDVAMAVLPDADKRPPADILRFVQEARLTASLEHPNIVPVHDIGIDKNGAPYFTMKLLRGKTLAAFLKSLADEGVSEEDYPMHRLLRIFLKICSGVAFAHSKGVLHLDLKPENIQLGDFGEVLIIDWGLAKMMDNESNLDSFPAGTMKNSANNAIVTMDGMMKGTPGYMSPEQAAGKNLTKDARTDIYALGAILYAMLTLQNPLGSKSVPDMIQDTLDGNIIPPRYRVPEREIPVALDAVVQKAMSLSPYDRYQSVTELRDEVNAFIGGYATVAEKASSLKKAMLLVKRHVILTVSAVILFLVLAVAGAVMLQDHQRQKAAWFPLCSVQWNDPTDVRQLPKGITYRKKDLSLSDGTAWRSSSRGLLLPRGEWLWLDLPLKSDWHLDFRYSVEQPGDSFEVRLQADPENKGADQLPSGLITRFGLDGGTRDIFYRQEPGKQPVQISGHVSGVAPGVIQEASFQRNDGRLTVRVGLAGREESLIDFLPPATEKQRRIGIRALSGNIRLHSLTLTNRGDAERSTPLVAADALQEVHLYEAAFDKYLKIAESYETASFSDRALLNSYRIAAIFAPDLKDREERLTELKKRMAARTRFQFTDRVREIDAARLWKEGQILASLRLVEIILQSDPTNDILQRLTAIQYHKFKRNEMEAYLSLLKRMRHLKTLSIAGFDWENLDPIRDLDLEYLDCTGNPITDYSALKNMPLRVLVTDSGVYTGEEAIASFLNK